MSEDKRITVRGSFYEVLEVAAERRHVSVAAFVTMCLSEYLRRCGELAPTHTAKPNNVSEASDLADIIAQFDKE